MDELSLKHLEHQPIPFKEVAGTGKSQVTFDKVPLDKATQYAAEDADVTLRLWQRLKPRLSLEGVTTVYETMDRPLIPVVAQMEAAGVKVDRDRLSVLSGEFAQRMAAYEAEAYEQAGNEFNIGSPKQIGDILFGEMGLPGGKKTKTGAWSTGADTLEDLAAEGHQLPRTILNWRTLAKLRSTYGDPQGRDQPRHRPRPHLVLARGRTDRPSLLDRSQSPEHPDPHRGRPQDPRGLHR